MSRQEFAGHGVLVLRNWILGSLAIAIWTINHLVYFAPDIRAARNRHRRLHAFPAKPAGTSPDRGFTGPLPPDQRRPFPPPEPSPPVHDAEIIPFPKGRRA